LDALFIPYGEKGEGRWRRKEFIIKNVLVGY